MQLSPELPLSPPATSPGNGFYGDIDGWCEDVKQVADDIESTTYCVTKVPKSENCFDIDYYVSRSKASTGFCTADSKVDIQNSSVYESVKRTCLVCGDIASGLHYGIASCEACKAFFKRTVQGHIEYVCPANGRCEMTRKRRKACQACRYKKCLDQGMNPEGIRPDRSKGGQSSRFGPSRSNSLLTSLGTSACTISSNKVDGHGHNRILTQLLNIEPQKVYATPNDWMADGEDKFMTTISNLVDRDLVATIGWAKQVPGFVSLPLSDQMTLLQSTWLDIVHFNFSYRSALQRDTLVFSDDFQVPCEDVEKYGECIEFTMTLRKLANKLASLLVTREEYVLLKATILLNADNGVAVSPAVDSVRHQIFDALLQYERATSRARNMSATACNRRPGELLLALPILTQQVVLAKRFWCDVKSRGHVSVHRLLDEMVDHVLRV